MNYVNKIFTHNDNIIFTMNYNALQKLIEKKTNETVSRAKIAEIIGTSRQNINTKFNNPKSEVSVSELIKLEKHFKVSLYPGWKSEPILNPDFSLAVEYELNLWGKRLLMLQVTSKMLENSVFSKYLDISEKRLDDFIRKNKYPNGEELLKIKTRFSKTDIDWLLFGSSDD